MLAWLVVILLVVPAVWVAMKGTGGGAAPETAAGDAGQETHPGGDASAGFAHSDGAVDPGTGLLLAPVGRMLGRAYQMYDAGAYVHQYEEHGVGRGHFEEAFARVEDVLAAYRAI